MIYAITLWKLLPVFLMAAFLVIRSSSRAMRELGWWLMSTADRKDALDATAHELTVQAARRRQEWRNSFYAEPSSADRKAAA